MALVRRPALGGRGGSLRAVLTLLVILTFGFQGFIAQTHVHSARLPDASIVTVTKAFSPQTGKLPLPAPIPADKCPLCQLATSLGAAIGVTTTLIILPASTLAILPTGTDHAVPKTPPSFVWRNRGPPRT
jgi:hypothetical protein